MYVDRWRRGVGKLPHLASETSGNKKLPLEASSSLVYDVHRKSFIQAKSAFLGSLGEYILIITENAASRDSVQRKDAQQPILGVFMQ